MAEPQALRVAVKIQPARDASGGERFNATLPMGVLFEKSLDRGAIEQERAALQEKYGELVRSLRSKRVAMKAGNLASYWEFGDILWQFEQEQLNTMLFVEQLIAHLVRDVSFSETMILLCRRFRDKIPDSSQIDTRQTFTNYYRAGFDPARLPMPKPRRQRARI